MRDINNESMHIAAQSPIIGMRMTLVKGPWGGNEDSMKNVLHNMTADGPMTITDINDDGRYVSVMVSGDGDDMDYLTFADRVFERFSEYMPQVEMFTEEEQE